VERLPYNAYAAPSLNRIWSYLPMASGVPLSNVGYVQMPRHIYQKARSVKRRSEAREKVRMRREYGGIHTLPAVRAGLNEGIQIADHVFAHALQPATH